MPAVETEMGLTHDQAGSLFLMVTIGYFVTLVLSGHVSSRIGHRKTIILATALVAVCMLLIGLSRNLTELRASLVLLGLGAGLYLPSGLATLTDIVGQRHWAKAIAIHELAPNLSQLLAPVLAEAVLAAGSWRLAAFVLAGLTAVLGVCYAVKGRGGEFNGQAPGFSLLKSLAGQERFWIIILFFSVAMGGSLGIYTMTPLFLINTHGFERTWANTLLILSRIVVLPVSLISGWLADRIGFKAAMIGFMALTGLFTVVYASVGPGWLEAVVFIQPAVAVCMFPAGFAALGRIGRPEERNVVVSFAIPLATLVGMGVFPTFIGWTGDHYSFVLGFMITGVMLLATALLTARITFADQPQGRP